MHIQTIRSIAKGYGINASKGTKAELIRRIQKAEGNFDCFGSATDGYCDQTGCNWRSDCLPAPKKSSPKQAAPAKPKAAAAAKPKAAPKPKATAKAKTAGKTTKASAKVK